MFNENIIAPRDQVHYICYFLILQPLNYLHCFYKRVSSLSKVRSNHVFLEFFMNFSLIFCAKIVVLFIRYLLFNDCLKMLSPF